MNVVEDKLIVYESTPDFSDNPRGLYEYVKKHTDYMSFWIVKDRKMEAVLKEAGVDCALAGSEEAKKMIGKAHFLVSSSFAFAGEKKAGQIHVSAWHGFPLKLIGFFDSASADGKNTFGGLKTITTKSDIITCSSRFSQLTIAGMFAVDPRKVKITGFPRNDIMYEADARKELKKIVDADIEGSKLIFYLPTMRKGLKNEGAQFEENFFNYPDYDADVLDTFLESQNAYMFAKVHFADNEYFTKGDFKLPKRLVFLNTEALNDHMLTIYHIMDAFDILVTDYSSVYADFLLLNKPILFSCPDIDAYKKDRGFIVDDPELFMPGERVRTQKEFIAHLNEIFMSGDSHGDERMQKMSVFHRHQDADSGKRLFDEMIRAAEQGVDDAARDMENFFFDPRVYSYGKEGHYEMFFDCGNGFNEDEKVVGQYFADEKNRINIAETLPENTKAVRFDPDDIGRCQLKDFKVIVDGREIEYSIENGAVVDETIVFDPVDPRIVIPVSGKAGEIRIEYVIQDFYASAAGQLIRKDRELHDMLTSQSWKVTKPLRDIMRVVRSSSKKGK